MEHGETIARVAMRPSDLRERIAAIAVSCGLIGLTLGWSLTQRNAWLTSPQFVAAYGTALTLCAIFIAILLIWRARLVGDAPSARIAAAFVYCVPLVTAYALTYPGTVPAFGAGREASGWMWFGWRIGWAVAVTWYAVRPGRPGIPGRSIPVALLCSAGMIGLAFSGKLPDWYDPGSGAHLPPASVAYCLVIATTALAFACLLRLKPMTTLNVWLTVPLIANIVVGVLGIFDRVRFGGLADASRLLAVASAAVVVWALVAEFARLLERADQLVDLYAHEHQVAQTLQSAFIPQFLPQVRGLHFQAVYRPALREPELGGDWYDAFVLPDGRIALSIGDVAGHGIAAAIAMVRLRETLRVFTGFDDMDPGSILQTTNRAFMSTHPDTIATIAFALYDPATRRLVRASAGHPPPALVRKGLTSFLRGTSGLPLGVQSEGTFAAETHVLEPGDRIVFYTDGLVEAERDIIAGEQRLAGVLARHGHDADRVVSETLAGTQRDDVALLALTVLDFGGFEDGQTNQQQLEVGDGGEESGLAWLEREGRLRT